MTKDINGDEIKKLFFKIAATYDEKSFYIERKENLIDALSAENEDHKFIVSPVWMTEQEYVTLPEFVGF